METEAQRRGELQGLLVLMASLSHGLETVLGRGAATITFRAGRTIGLKADVSETADDIVRGVQLVQAEMIKNGVCWPCELWKPEGAADYFYDKDGKKAAKIVFHHCMVRCSLFRYSHEQKQSLCMMNHGLFCGYLQKILGKRVDLEILHAGENACLKELVIHEKGG
jgi:predicted hydrocarbon binding protein